MKAIIIGAGRGSRLMPSTADIPKCFCQVGDHRILDWSLKAFAENGITDIVFIGGYQIDKVRDEYQEFKLFDNDNWANNNILASLMVAEPEMDDGFICCYSDILFTGKVIGNLLADQADITVVIDTDWDKRYMDRTEHPPDDAEKVTVDNGLVTRIHREIPNQEAHGEFIGVTKFSKKGAELLKESYYKAKEAYTGKPFRGAKSFEKAYLILLYQEMIEQNITIAHVDTHGDYIEIDTQQDFEYARQHWR